MKCQIYFICFAFLIGSIRAQIIGGKDADIKHFPYQASVRVGDDHYCGACIIGERHILTAAHCIDENFIAPYMGVSVSTGTASSKANTGQSHSIAAVTVAPEWDVTKRTTLIADIAVITLVNKIRFDDKQQRIKLASEDIVSGTDALITGWGLTTPVEGSKISEKLQKLRLTLLNYKDCQSQYTQIRKLHKEHLCAFHPNGRGPYYGDSGGPLINDLNEVVGVLSFSVEHKSACTTPEIYTNVYHYAPFIRSVMKT